MWARVSGKVLSVESNFLVQARLNRFRVVLHIQESLRVKLCARMSGVAYITLI